MSIDHHCYVIGLTGGIASGKSAVSRMFEDLGSNVIDADVVAREVVEPGTEGLMALTKEFGPEILKSNGTLDRTGLRKMVFNNEHKLKQLNAILHPLIHEKIKQKISQVTDNYCIVVIPLLCESSNYKWLDRILVVDVPPQVQLQRLMSRDGITEALAQKMMNSQCTRKQRLLIADDVIKNDKTLDELKGHVETLHKLYEHH